MQPPSDDIVLTLMLAEYAQVHAGKLFIFGGGVFAAFAAGPVHIQQLAVCGTIAIPFAELHREHTIKIDLLTQDEIPVLVPTPMGDQPFQIEAKVTAALPPLLPRGTTYPLPFAAAFALPISPGTYHFRALVEGHENSKVKLPLTVLPAPAGMVQA